MKAFLFGKIWSTWDARLSFSRVRIFCSNSLRVVEPPPPFRISSSLLPPPRLATYRLFPPPFPQLLVSLTPHPPTPSRNSLSPPPPSVSQLLVPPSLVSAEKRPDRQRARDVHLHLRGDGSRLRGGARQDLVGGQPGGGGRNAGGVPPVLREREAQEGMHLRRLHGWIYAFAFDTAWCSTDGRAV